MGWTIGIPSLKLSETNNKSKHCGNFYNVAAEALKERIGRDPDINRELSDSNIYLGFETAEELIKYSNSHCETLRDSRGRTLRSDAVRMCVTLIKPPAAFMTTLSREEQLRFLDDAVAKLKEIVGEDNVKSTAIHFDEQGTHVHVFWEPMTEDGRLCAKEIHNLQFFGRLNREMPEHLRKCGWDIDDCNVYDQALHNLKSEQEKSALRKKNGRDSATFKADAERQLSEINAKIEITLNSFEEKLDNTLRQSIENVVNDSSGVYDNVLYLMAECDDKRFDELDEEGRKLKEEKLKKFTAIDNPDSGLDKFIENVKSRKRESISWETKQMLWDEYRLVSEDFWELRAEMNEKNKQGISKAYDKRRDATSDWYEGMRMLRKTRTFSGIFAALLWLCIAEARQKRAERQIEELKKERQILIENTASFKKFSNAYRDELKAGKIPCEKYISSIQKVIETLDEEAERFHRHSLHKHKSMLKER